VCFELACAEPLVVRNLSVEAFFAGAFCARVLFTGVLFAGIFFATLRFRRPFGETPFIATRSRQPFLCDVFSKALGLGSFF
jgi:hypothetical protein